MVVEIGFGGGEFLLDMAARQPEVNFLGIELSHKRVHKVALRLAKSGLSNVRLLCAAAEPFVADYLPLESVSAFWVNFPDPWPKRRHESRRLLQPRFMHSLAERLHPGGRIHIATDHCDYANWIDRVVCDEPLLENAYAPRRFLHDVPGRMPTAYEEAWRTDGRTMHYLAYSRPLDADVQLL